MSRIGKKPVALPQGVTATISGQSIEVKGPKGTRSFTATDDVDLVLEDGAVAVKPRGSSKRARQQWGMTRSMLANLAEGVSAGFKKDLEFFEIILFEILGRHINKIGNVEIPFPQLFQQPCLFRYL